MDIKKIGIGTAQFGLDYGISNKIGKVSLEEAAKILEIATQNNIRFIDTAMDYGDSEEVLGKALLHKHHFTIVTKTPKFLKASITHDDVLLMENSFYRSLSKLNLSSVYGLLIHIADDLLAENGHILMEKMLDFKQRGLVEKIGVSVYTGEQIDKVLENFSIDLIQLPINIFDQRLIANGYLLKLKKRHIEIHARSIFLQGLLLMDPAAVPSYFDQFSEHLFSYWRYLKKHGISPLQNALQFALQLPEIDIVLVGVCSAVEFKEIISTVKQLSSTHLDYSSWSIDDERFINPMLWELNN